MLYMDFNATTPLDTKVLDIITNAARDEWANASSAYREGVDAKKLITESRHRVMQMINANSPNEITFTSGGTEV